MGWLGWTLTFLGLALLALGVLALLALRLWRAGKALGRDLARASTLTTDLMNRRRAILDKLIGDLTYNNAKNAIQQVHQAPDLRSQCRASIP